MPIAWFFHYYTISPLKHKYKAGQLPATSHLILSTTGRLLQILIKSERQFCCKMTLQLKGQGRIDTASLAFQQDILRLQVCPCTSRSTLSFVHRSAHIQRERWADLHQPQRTGSLLRLYASALSNRCSKASKQYSCLLLSSPSKTRPLPTH